MAKQEENKKSTPRSRGKNTNELIHCENCGEYYAATYRSCPFCDERPTRGRGTNKRGGGYGAPLTVGQVVRYVLSLVVILAAVAIVVFLIRNLAGNAPVEATTSPSASQPVESVEPTSLPLETDAPEVSNATGITLDHSDFTMNKTNETVTITATVTPSDYTGTIVWTSSDPSKVYVSQQGVVYAISPGTVDVTATIGDYSATCIVRNKATGALLADMVTDQTPSEESPAAATESPDVSSSPEPSTESNTTSTSPITLNRSDFTMRSQDPATFQMTASGGDGQNYTWTSSNTDVVTVSDTGLVTRVGTGMCTITVTSGGQTATCTVRVS